MWFYSLEMFNKIALYYDEWGSEIKHVSGNIRCFEKSGKTLTSANILNRKKVILKH